MITNTERLNHRCYVLIVAAATLVSCRQTSMASDAPSAYLRIDARGHSLDGFCFGVEGVVRRWEYGNTAFSEYRLLAVPTRINLGDLCGLQCLMYESPSDTLPLAGAEIIYADTEVLILVDVTRLRSEE